MTLSASVAEASSGTLYASWFDQFIGPGDKPAMLIGIAGIAAVIWTAGFVVRSFGQKPNRLLRAAMNYAQLCFMGGLVSAFLMSIALQAVALVFLLQEAGQITSALYIRAKKPDERTFGEQKYMEFLDIDRRRGLLEYFAIETPYIAGILLILRWPTQFVAIPMTWIALYLSYQILLFFLYTPREQDTAQNAATQPAAITEPTSLQMLKEYQRGIGALLETQAVIDKHFAGNVAARIEAVIVVSQLNECTDLMSQWHTTGVAQFTTFVGSAYMHTLIQHRIAADRLSMLITNTPYPVSPGGQFELVMRAEQGVDHLMARYAVETNGRLVVNVWNTQASTTVATDGVLWLGESYIETANACLAGITAALSS